MGYKAEPITVTRRTTSEGEKIGPKSPCGIAIPVGWILTDNGEYVRERSSLTYLSVKNDRD